MKKIFAYIFVAILLSGCGTTQLVVSHPDVDIYVRNVNKGKGIAVIKRAGRPEKQTIVAKYNGEKVGELNIKRRFDIITALVGLETYGLGFIFCWRYPSVIYIPIKLTEQEPVRNKESIWMKPPKMWKY